MPRNINPAIRIDRCVCSGTSFDHLRETSRKVGAESIPALQEHATFGQNCRLCLPYICRMLKTGTVVFTEIIPEESMRVDCPEVFEGGGAE